MQAINIGKTILVWNDLSESEVQRVIKAIEKLINTYRNLTDHNKFDRVIPVPLFDRGYSLSPNINPQDFIKHLQNNTLSDFQKRFLTDIGMSLDNPNFSKTLQDTIKEANDLFK